MNLSNSIEILMFTRHLATMMKAGIPIDDALSTLAEQTKSNAFKRTIEDILSSVNNGQTLAQSLSHHPKVFDAFYVSLIEISEQSGSLDTNLDFIALQLSKSYNLRKKIQSAMLYPALIGISAAVMGGFIAFFILPKLVDFFTAFNVELPVTTKVLLFVATLFKNYGLFIGIFAVISVLLFRTIIRWSVVKPAWDSFVLRLPIFGKFLSDTELAQFSRNFGILIKSGIPIVKSINIVERTLSNQAFKKALHTVGSSLSKGKNISDTMAKNTDVFPPLVSKMIQVGEKTGKLDESLLYLGDLYEEEIDNFSKNLTTILEPILLLTIGLVVGFLALAIITPIYELSGSI